MYKSVPKTFSLTKAARSPKVTVSFDIPSTRKDKVELAYAIAEEVTLINHSDPTTQFTRLVDTDKYSWSPSGYKPTAELVTQGCQVLEVTEVCFARDKPMETSDYKDQEEEEEEKNSYYKDSEIEEDFSESGTTVEQVWFYNNNIKLWVKEPYKDIKTFKQYCVVFDYSNRFYQGVVACPDKDPAWEYKAELDCYCEKSVYWHKFTHGFISFCQYKQEYDKVQASFHYNKRVKVNPTEEEQNLH